MSVLDFYRQADYSRKYNIYYKHVDVCVQGNVSYFIVLMHSRCPELGRDTTLDPDLGLGHLLVIVAMNATKSTRRTIPVIKTGMESAER